MFKELRRRIDFLRFHRVHMLSRARIEAWQENRLRMMVAHAVRNVPIYSELYRDVDPAVRAHPTLGNLRQFPVITKKIFMGRQVEEYTDNSARTEGAWATTSGTSGEPFTMLTRADFREPYYAESIIYRAFLSNEPWRFQIKPRIARIMTKSPPQQNRMFITISDFRAEPEKTIERLIEFRPEGIESFASILYAIAETVKRTGMPLKPKYLISGGERLSDGLREHVERVLGCKIYNRYGMEEFTVLAMECDRHDGMHTNCESLIIEIIDEKGIPVPDGEFGRIVVTDLYNVGMPFIRYDTGDHGSVSREKCACGKESPRVWLEGRYSASLAFNGRRINHLEFDAALEMFMNVILQYQVVKYSETDAAVVIIPGVAFNAETEAKIIANIASLVGTGVNVRVECVELIPEVPRGKSRIVSDLSVAI